MEGRPILFSGEMVRALLDGRKTQTRRIIKPQPNSSSCEAHHYSDDDQTWIWRNGYDGSIDGKVGNGSCPYGQPGDYLWVREGIWEPRQVSFRDLREGADTWPACMYVSDMDQREADWCIDMKWRKRPSIHMKREFSRLTLKITDVRVERVQDISDEDARAEGISGDGLGWFDYQHLGERRRKSSSRQCFQTLWDSINSNWNDNHWVWVIEFEVIKQNIDEVLATIAEGK